MWQMNHDSNTWGVKLGKPCCNRQHLSLVSGATGELWRLLWRGYGVGPFSVSLRDTPAILPWFCCTVSKSVSEVRFWTEPTPSHTQQFHSCVCWWKPKAWAITLRQQLEFFKHLNMCSRCECYSTRIHRCKKFHISLAVCLLLELE